MKYKFAVGDKVVYTNDFGVCWGVKTITELSYRLTTRNDADARLPAYLYMNIDTPWSPVSERNLVLADVADLAMEGEDEFFQKKYGWTPTIEQLGGCY